MAYISRRRFIGNSAAMLGTAGTFASLASRNAFSANTDGYKALVCVFFFGGLDQNDTILPVDQTSYDLFAGRRSELMGLYGVGSGTSSRDRANILRLNALNSGVLGGREYGLPQELAPLRDLFDSQELAVMGSVGPLIEPVTRAQFAARNVALPKSLFSHNDQQSTWMALSAEGAQRGWGGLFLDAAIRSNGQLNATYAGLTTSSNATFLTGDLATAFSLPASGPVRVNAVTNGNILGGGNVSADARNQLQAWLEETNFNNANVFARDAAQLQAKGVVDGARFADEYENAASLATSFPANGLGAQLRAVAEAISIRDRLQAQRQIYFVGIGGFDSHSNQAASVPALQTQIAGGIRSFRDAMIELGVWNDVTLFTASDFGRTLNDNGDGTDHGWAGHHFVAGGSVRGGRIYGDLPNSDADSDDYTDSRGRLIPTTAVDQYAATLGQWFGLDTTELNGAFPNLRNFNSADLGFMS